MTEHEPGVPVIRSMSDPIPPVPTRFQVTAQDGTVLDCDPEHYRKPVSQPLPPPGHIHDDDGTVEGCPGCFWEPDLSWILGVIERVDAHLDEAAPWQYRENLMANRWRRVTKVCEESGEVWRALSAWDGENPRRGVSGTREDVQDELADTACAALLAIQSITKDTGQTLEVFTAALAKALSRVPAGPVMPPESGMDDQAARDNGITG